MENLREKLQRVMAFKDQKLSLSHNRAKLSLQEEMIILLNYKIYY